MGCPYCGYFHPPDGMCLDPVKNNLTATQERDTMSEHVEAKVEYTTEKAHLIFPTMGPKQIWLPKSQINSQTEPDADGNVQFDVSDWWYQTCFLKEWEK